ncbi:hypothetical protein BGW80DRAFT_740387 [Lactifluus volemus]|nr:hypothetical protein BGW80DRAFT_740387 [Lactifluus volemus]
MINFTTGTVLYTRRAGGRIGFEDRHGGEGVCCCRRLVRSNLPIRSVNKSPTSTATYIPQPVSIWREHIIFCFSRISVVPRPRTAFMLQVRVFQPVNVSSCVETLTCEIPRLVFVTGLPRSCHINSLGSIKLLLW